MSIEESKKQMNSVDRREQESMIYHHHHKGYLSVTLEPRGPTGLRHAAHKEEEEENSRYLSVTLEPRGPTIAARSSSWVMLIVGMPSTAVIKSPLEQMR